MYDVKRCAIPKGYTGKDMQRSDFDVSVWVKLIFCTGHNSCMESWWQGPSEIRGGEQEIGF